MPQTHRQDHHRHADAEQSASAGKERRDTLENAVGTKVDDMGDAATFFGDLGRAATVGMGAPTLGAGPAAHGPPGFVAGPDLASAILATGLTIGRIIQWWRK